MTLALAVQRPFALASDRPLCVRLGLSRHAYCIRMHHLLQNHRPEMSASFMLRCKVSGFLLLLTVM